MRLSLLFIFTISLLQANSQNISCFTDYKKYFYAFDSGEIIQLEHLPVKEYKAADNCIAYINNGNKLKIYYNKETYEMATLVKTYNVTNNIVTYYTGGSQLYVFESGHKKVLSKFVYTYQTGDSIVAFFDAEDMLFKVYYNGIVRAVDDGLIYPDVYKFFVGNNILAYIDTYRNFKVFFQGKTYEIMNSDEILRMDLGRNIMAYIDPSSGYLNIFFNKEIIETDIFRPKSFMAGYEKIAFIDDLGNLKLFDNGYIYEVSNSEPEKYYLKNDILVYHLSGQLYIFHNGESYMVENYIPETYKISNNAIAYIDLNMNLKIVKDGIQKVLTYEKVTDFEIYNNVIVYQQGVNTVKVYFNGKEYSN